MSQLQFEPVQFHWGIEGYPLVDTQKSWPVNVEHPSRHLVPQFKGWVKDEFGQLIQKGNPQLNLIKDQIQQFGDILKLQDSGAQLNSNEVTNLEQEILGTLRHDLVAEKTFIFKQIGQGMTDYKYNKLVTPIGPERSNTFEFKQAASVLKQSTSIPLHGMGYRFHIPKTILDASRGKQGIESFGESIDVYTLRELTASLRQYRDWWIFRGADSPNMVDTGINGIVNDSSLTDPGAMGGGADDDMKDSGDLIVSAAKLAGFLATRKHKGPYDLHLTPGLWAQSILNINATTNLPDMVSLRQMADENGNRIIRNIVFNPYLIDSETETNSTAAMAMIAPGWENCGVVESYGLSYYPLPQVNLGMDGLLFWMGAPVVRRPTAIAFADALTIETLSA